MQKLIAHLVQHDAELKIVLQPVEALAEAEKGFRQEPGARLAQDVLLCPPMNLQAVRYRKRRRKE
jgi:hypothetical protein